MKQRSLAVLALGASLALAACTQTQSREVAANDASGYPARLPLTGVSLPVEAAPAQPEGGKWQLAGETLSFAVPGGATLLAMNCTHAPDGTAQLHLTRMTRAEDGAKALFALIGNGRIARLPLDATRAGEQGEWQGTMPAADPRLEVLRGGNRIEATLPGGGTLLLPASLEPGRLLAACRASDRA
ncbi:hypothetical protein H7F51_08975 [Novosphingobium flavum]|uniref:Uncharacterized protein n=1 Tax=Novosphingobium flavum TaxID=1778672 RepID=A0A7X1FRJ4_9SPHN|nr:hypothetical protein [Novosphingobium flavum]MBC2665656.1 hypothetical protein [Novosphingobium flavum]